MLLLHLLKYALVVRAIHELYICMLRLDWVDQQELDYQLVAVAF